MKTGDKEGEKHTKTGDEGQGEEHKKSGEEGKKHKNGKHDGMSIFILIN